MNYVKFPFGKYKGYPIDEIPLNYIVYALENMDLPDELNEQLKESLIEQLELDVKESKEDINIKYAYKTMAKKYHPDMGGSDYAMQIINEFYNIIK
jgi:uncharacterized protein (DUF3820 family)